MFQVDVLVRDEIESVNILSDFLVGGDNPCCLFKGSSETMMMIMSLEPVVMVVTFLKIAEVVDFDDLFSVVVDILFHILQK